VASPNRRRPPRSWLIAAAHALAWLMFAAATADLVAQVRSVLRPTGGSPEGHGCVMRGAGGWTLVYALSSGPLRVDAAFDPRRLITRSACCTPVRESPGSNGDLS
jgi:hypothetical protein